MGTEAVVLCPAEAEMSVGGAADIEAVGIVEHLLIAISGAVEHRHRLALADQGAVELVVAKRRAFHVVDRGRPAHDLLDRRLDQ